MPAFESIRRVLASLQSCLKALLLKEGALLAAALLALGASLAIALSHIGLAPSKSTGFVLVLFAVSVFFWVRYRGPMFHALRGMLNAAHLAERLESALGTGPSSAVAFAEELISHQENPPFSEPLARAHVQETARVLADTPLEKHVPAHLGVVHRWAPRFCAGSLALFAFTLGGLETGRTRLGHFMTGNTAAVLSDVPLVGDIRLTYTHPLYTGLGPRVVEGSDGRIETLKASQVLFEATADEAIEEATLVILTTTGTPLHTVPMVLQNENRVEARFSVMQNGRYYIALTTSSGDKKRDRREHPIVLTQDAHPTIRMDTPATDLELKQTDNVPIVWRARDDFGVAEVFLVIESGGADAKTERVPLARAEKVSKDREGRYLYRPAELAFNQVPGVVIYLEAIDNDTISGPKRSTSARRRIDVFSARRHHARIQAQLQQTLDALVDLLSSELTTYAAAANAGSSELKAVVINQATAYRLLKSVYERLEKLTQELAEDTLSTSDMVLAFTNTSQRLAQGLSARENAVKRQVHISSLPAKVFLVTGTQERLIPILEKDIAYLDDILALGRIDDLKQTASDLLASQRELQGLLEAFKNTQDPKLRKELEGRIQEMRKEMMELLARMSQIKKSLPGEYRNMESGSMLKVDDQLGRLEEMLQAGDLEGAARELEQLANMIEQMVESIDEAEESYGGEQYDELREQMAQFAQEFEALENQQQALKKRTDEMVERYRDEAMKKTGESAQGLANKLLALIDESLEHVDTLGSFTKLSTFSQKQLTGARTRLLDLVLLVKEQDFAESRLVAQGAKQYAINFSGRITRSVKSRNLFSEEDAKLAQKESLGLVKKTQTIKALLDELFPDPEDVLSQNDMRELQKMAQKQDALEQQAGEVGQKMLALAEEVPVFGQAPMKMLQSARQEMQSAGRNTRDGKLPNAAHHGERAVGQLKQMREALEQSSQGGGGQGVPLPLGSQSQKGNQRGHGNNMRSEDVELPQADGKAGGPSFREDLLKAAKQDAPQDYEEAVRKYYRELIK